MEMTIHEKLMMIQQGLNAPKSQRNDFGKYNYRSCEDILQAVKPLLSETKTVVLLSDSVVEIGCRIYIRATAMLRDTESAEYIMAEAYAREEESKKGMDASQVTGAASSYARKYALNGLFAIDDNKDSDATNDGRQEQKKQPPKPPKEVPPPPEAFGPREASDGYYYCDSCGQMISGFKDKTGKVWSPKDVVAASIGKYGGRQLCLACARNEANA